MASKESSGSDASAEFERLRKDLDRVKNDISHLASAVRDAGSAKASQARRTVEDELQHVAERVRSGTRSARDTIEGEVHERPLVTLLIAFGVGVLLGKILDR